MEFSANTVYIFNTIGHIFTILPHAGKGRIANGANPFNWQFYWDMHFNDRALFDCCVLKGPENATFVFRGDRHACAFSVQLGAAWLPS